MPLFLHEHWTISIGIWRIKWERKIGREYPDEHHFSWWITIKGHFMHELGLDYWNTEIGTMMWVSLHICNWEAGRQNYTVDWVEYHFQIPKEGVIGFCGTCAWVLSFVSELMFDQYNCHRVPNLVDHSVHTFSALTELMMEDDTLDRFEWDVYRNKFFVLSWWSLLCLGYRWN